MIDPILLGFLMYGEMSGYSLKQAIQSGPSHFYDASFGSIYPSLKRLEHQGLVASRSSTEGKRVKKYYTLLPKGESVFMTWLRSPMAEPTHAANFLTRIFFFEFLERKEVERILLDYKERVAGLRATLQKIDETVHQQSSAFQYGTLSYGLAYYDFLYEWLDGFIRSAASFPASERTRYRQWILEKGGQI